MSTFWGRWTRRARRVLGTASAVLALLLLATPSALAAPGPQLTVGTVDATRATLLATGFAPSSMVRFRLTVGTCAGDSSVVVTGDPFRVDFVTAAPCTGVAVVTAAIDLRPGVAATASFVLGDPAAAVPPALPTLPALPALPALPSLPAGPTAQATPAAATPGDVADPAAPGKRPVASRCTVRASGGGVPAARPGDVVCFTGTLPSRLEIRGGGTPEAPIVYSGTDTTTVPGITARADNIVIEGFVSRGATDNGMYVSGKNITVQDNDISKVNIGNDDVDATRFFGDDITIRHNYSHDIWANPERGGQPHTDCMQTYTSDSEPASSNVRIEGNRCASPQFRQCLMAEGPRDDDGDGQGSGIGNSANWTVADNYFECHAPAQTVALQDIQNVTFSTNEFAGTGSKAIALQKRATGATVTPDNVKGPGYRVLVGIDDPTAQQGFRGPAG